MRDCCVWRVGGCRASAVSGAWCRLCACVRVGDFVARAVSRWRVVCRGAGGACGRVGGDCGDAADFDSAVGAVFDFRALEWSAVAWHCGWVCWYFIVLAPRIAAVPVEQLGQWQVALAVNLAGMLAVTLGTFYQKRFLAQGDLRSMAFLQYVGALPVALLAAYLV